MKKFIKIICMAMMLVLCFSMTAFAAENEGSSDELEVTFTNGPTVNFIDENTDIGILPKAPAPAVSSVQVVGATIKSDGCVYVTVNVVGYGKNIYSTYDGMQYYVSSSTPVGSPVVTGYRYEVKCAPATVGNHNFTFRITSVNSPWNTMSTSAVITVS